MASLTYLLYYQSKEVFLCVVYEQKERGRVLNKEGDGRGSGQGNVHVYGRAEVGANKDGGMFEVGQSWEGSFTSDVRRGHSNQMNKT